MKVSKGAMEAQNSQSTLEKLLHSFERYYNVRTDDLAAPFSATAEFHSHSEQYFLVKSARLAEVDSNEYVYFIEEKELSPSRFSELSSLAWERGLAGVRPHSTHRNSDVTLIIISEKIAPDTLRQIKKCNLHKSYKFGFYGWSNLRIMAYETSTGRTVTNRYASDLKKLAGTL